MKITCQACQSKYTIADDKIQGKVAKIRCRKCGATVLVDASAGSGAHANGSVAPPAPSEVWLVSVAEGDQRTMSLAEVVDAYNSGVIVGDTYLWKEGMGDWQPLSEIAEIVSALNEANTAAQDDYQAPAPAAYTPPAAAYSPPAAAYSPPAVAARRETGRGRGDLFGGGAAVEEEVATSAPQHVARGGGGGGGAMLGGGMSADTSAQRSGLTGARDEHSVLFSLSALTGGSGNKAASAPPIAMTSAPTPSARNEDSGLIDLNALAKAQQQTKATEEVAPLAAPTPFLFPAALGTMEPFPAAEASKPKKSSMPMFIGGGVVAVIAIGIAIFALGKKDEPVPAPTGAVSAEPAPTVAPPTPATAEATPTETAPAASAKAAAPKKMAGGGGRPAKPSGAAPAAPALPTPAAKPKSPCGCAGSDLQCQIRCSAMGK